jgi:oligopeptide/dipeptide ABC transporter ATP-binding protein
MGQVGIPSPEDRLAAYPHQLSGGMRQRVMIAMALAAEPDVLIADEPTTALDVTIQAQVLDLMAELGRETGTAIILVTHDLGVVARLCDRVVVLYGGRVMEEASAETLFDAPVHPYTRGLLAAMPRLETALTPRLRTIPGTPRSGGQVIGCPFVSRCEARLPDCAIHRPPLRDLTALDHRHRVACHLTGTSP